MMKRYGQKYGHAALSSEIKHHKKGIFRVRSKKARDIILNLRKDPRTASLFAAEYARSNKILLQKALKRFIQPSDLYIAHFLGPGSAIRLIQTVEKDPKKSAARLFPEAARANKRIFYKKDGKTPRTVAQVHKLLVSVFQKAVRKFTNLPSSFIASLPQVLPTGKPSITGASMKPLVAPLEKKSLYKKERPAPYTAINLDSYKVPKRKSQNQAQPRLPVVYKAHDSIIQNESSKKDFTESGFSFSTQEMLWPIGLQVKPVSSYTALFQE
jgi:hypothetical protein